VRIDELDTPAVVVDLDVLDRNLKRLAAYSRDHQLAFRPHTKTHKIPEIARKQIETGACGITVAKVGEAEVMAEAGLDNILIAYPILGKPKLDRLMKLAHSRRITVALDSVEAVDGISSAANQSGCNLGILVECDLGMQRCGLQTVPEILKLARHVSSLPNVVFNGILFYVGQIWVDPASQPGVLEQIGIRVQEILEALQKDGLPCQVVSGGSTPTAFNSHWIKGLTEIRCGTYVFNDRNTLGLGACSLADCALNVLVTVVSNAVSGKAMIDGGSKTFSSDRLLSGGKSGFGLVLEQPAIIFESMSEEHGQLVLSASDYRPHVGERLSILPNHVCACVNLHDEIFYHRSGVVEGSWSVKGRGRLR
jgi:D-serine deaminase-like pyridoxal phosphate-dependent protein